MTRPQDRAKQCAENRKAIEKNNKKNADKKAPEKKK